MRDSVPSTRYSSICNVLRLWRIWLIPTYRVNRLYDNSNNNNNNNNKIILMLKIIVIIIIIIIIIIIYNTQMVAVALGPWASHSEDRAEP